jgi:hypothetical protein
MGLASTNGSAVTRQPAARSHPTARTSAAARPLTCTIRHAVGSVGAPAPTANERSKPHRSSARCQEQERRRRGRRRPATIPYSPERGCPPAGSRSSHRHDLAHFHRSELRVRAGRRDPDRGAQAGASMTKYPAMTSVDSANGLGRFAARTLCARRQLSVEKLLLRAHRSTAGPYKHAGRMRAACRNRTDDLLITSASGAPPGTARGHRARPFPQLRRDTERHLAPTVTRCRRIRRDQLVPSSDPRLSPSEASPNLLSGAHRPGGPGPTAAPRGRSGR